MGKGVKVRNTSVNGGMTGRDQTIDKVFAHKDGTTYSTMKTYAPAGNPNTSAQQLVRDTFAQTSAGWSGLTEGQRELWNGDAPNWTGTNIFGTTKPSGKNLYTGVNVALKSAGKVIISVPDNKENQSVVSDALFSLAMEVEANVATPNANERLQLHVSPQLSAGTSVNSKYVILKNIPMAASITTDVNLEYIAKYGAIQPNKKIFWKIKTVSEGGNVTQISQGMFITV
jgi:hypothetical protein